MNIPHFIPSRGLARTRGFVLALSVVASTAGFAAESPKPSPLPIERMRATAYTKEFAKRFALPDPEPGTEPSGGVQTMEFAVGRETQLNMIFIMTSDHGVAWRLAT